MLLSSSLISVSPSLLLPNGLPFRELGKSFPFAIPAAQSSLLVLCYFPAFLCGTRGIFFLEGLTGPCPSTFRAMMSSHARGTLTLFERMGSFLKFWASFVGLGLWRDHLGLFLEESQ